MKLKSLLCLFFLATSVAADEWNQFRGPRSAPVALGAKIPVEFGDKDKLIWKQKLPGPGSSSPIIVGNRIFLTCYTGYGLDRKNPGDDKKLVRHLLCLDRKTGNKIWQRSVKNKGNVALYVDFMPQHGYATPTPTSDGKLVYTFFDTSGVHAFDMNGKPVWNADVGEGFNGWGCGGSPILLGNLLIINAAIENGEVIAFNKTTGKVVWRGKKIYSSFSTPIVLTLKNGKSELIVNMLRKLVALDPTDGKRLWTFQTNRPYGVTCPVADGDKLYVVATRPTRLVAIRGGGQGDVTETRVVWSTPRVSQGIGSPIVVGDYLYLNGRGGVLSCVETKTGKVQYQRRIRVRGTYYASPIAAGNQLYFVSRFSGVQVFQQGPKFKLLATNQFQSDKSMFNGTPAVSGNRMYLRSDSHLYCVGE